jgi:glycogen(starch) synthase
MRILYQCNGFLPAIGGVEVLSYHLVTELRRRGHEVLVITQRAGLGAPVRETFDGLDLLRFDFGLPAIHKRDLPVLRDLSVTIASVVNGFQPDVLHLNDTFFTSFFFLRGGATGNVPRVLTLHSPIRPAGKDGLQARLATDADRVVAVSRALYDAALAAIPMVQSKLSMILNALPLPNLSPADLPFAPPLLLGVGRLVSDKGFDVAVRALALLRDRGTIARLTIAGNGQEKSSLETMGRDLGVANQVKFVNWVMPEQVASLINTATVVLMPSRWPEPFGLVALEAAQMGRPTIASAVGGLPEIVEHGLTGLLVEPNDEHALAEAIHVLLSDASLAIRLGANACRVAREKFDFHTLVDAYERVFAEARESACPARHEMVNIRSPKCAMESAY